MESKTFSSVLLEDFLNVSPKSALVLKSQSQPLSENSLKILYANPVFLDIIGYDFQLARLEALDAEASDNLASLLHAKCVHPSLSWFIKWVVAVLENPGEEQRLRTSFQWNKVSNDS